VRLAPGIGLPLFDSPSIFAAILDGRKGGFFKIAGLYEAPAQADVPA